MENRIIISLFLTLTCCVQLSFSQENKVKNTPNSIYTINLNGNDSPYNFNAFLFSQKIKNQLANYNLGLYKIDKIRKGSTYFTTKYFGKSFFKDSYIMYKDDLTKYFPKPPDLSNIDFRKLH